jgi:hypothetical protein
MLFAFVISAKPRLIQAALAAMLLFVPLLFAAPPVIHIRRLETGPTLADF